MSLFPSKTIRFQPRVPILRAIEGWHEIDGIRVKVSCRFRDILRCSEFNNKTRHFTSCFRKEGVHNAQPLRRCQDPTWAIVYLPDKHGNFMGRCFIRWIEKSNTLEIGRVYGNRLTQDQIRLIMTKFEIECLQSSVDTYL